MFSQPKLHPISFWGHAHEPFVLSIWFVFMFQACKNQWRCSKYVSSGCSKFALGTFSHGLSIVFFYVLSKGLKKWKHDVLSICPLLYTT